LWARGGGGLPLGATVLLSGGSGTGKTILATQWLFTGYDQFKEPGVYISLTEPVSKALKNAGKMAFFKKEHVNPTQVYFTDLRGILKGLDLSQRDLVRADIPIIIETLSHLVETSGAKRVVLDSITALAYRLKHKDLIREFIFELGTALAALDANVILTSEAADQKLSVFGVEEFISDGIIKLSLGRTHQELVRTLTVVKMRGIDYAAHPASFRISREGFILFPRLTRDLTYPVSEARIATGISGLDLMTCGGFLEGSSILLTGASGSGKSIMSLQFVVNAALAGKKALYISFEESRHQILRNAASFGWNLALLEQKEMLRFIVSYPEKRYLEEHIALISKEVAAFSPAVLVVDSLSSFGNVYSDDLLIDFVSRLNGFLKEKRITTIFTYATAALLGETRITDAHLSTITDHIIMLRYVEINSELHHAVLILKMRGSSHDKKLREIEFGNQGLRITTDFSGYEGVLFGSMRKVSATVSDQLRALFLETLGPMGEKIFAGELSQGLSKDRIQNMIKQLGHQGIVSKRKQEEFVQKLEDILGKDLSRVGQGSRETEPMGMEQFLRLGEDK
jgi:circadian clock protein KaiC